MAEFYGLAYFLGLFCGSVLLLWVFIHFIPYLFAVDIPNERSSHQRTTFKSGGVLFPLVFIGWYLTFEEVNWGVLLAVSVLAIISFLDDSYDLSVGLRLLVQIGAVGLFLIMATAWSWETVLLAIILFTGWLNTFNFMDGVNGITAVYGIVMIGSFWLLPSIVNHSLLFFGRLEPTMIIALLAFGVFNFRKTALCFAGDVGSISLALIICWIFLQHWQGWDTVYLLAFPMLYAVDSVMTILVRLSQAENIFQAHRSHIYQLLANEKGWDHRMISISYGGLQLLINGLAIYWIAFLPPLSQLLVLLLGYIAFSGLYFFIRSKVVVSPNL